MYRRFNKFFNRMKKQHTDYGPKQYFEPTPGENNLNDEPLFITKSEQAEFGFGSINQADFIAQMKDRILSIESINNKTCGQISASLNKIGFKTFKSNQWSSRLVAVFTRKYMSIKPKF